MSGDAVKRFLLVVLVVAVCFSVAYAASSKPRYGTINEARAYGLTNGSRLSGFNDYGSRIGPRGALGWDSTLADCAHAHAAKMARRGGSYIYHQAYCDGRRLDDQIVGAGSSPFLIYRSFLASSAHRGAIYGPYRTSGTGVAHDSDGTYYVVINFWK
jgi:uncharacterized protein YkwD